jgi:hypothetical protein
MIYHRICQKSNTLCSVSRVEQELLTLPQHMSSPPVLCAVRVAQSLVFCVMFCRSLSFCLVRFLLVIVCPFVLSVFFWSLSVLLSCPFSFGHCLSFCLVRFLLVIVCPFVLSVFFWSLSVLLSCPFSFGHCLSFSL